MRNYRGTPSTRLDGERVAAIICRLDLRTFSGQFARGILRLAEFCGCRLRDSSGLLFAPEWEELIRVLWASDEMRFVLDPRGFIEGLHGGAGSGP